MAKVQKSQVPPRKPSYAVSDTSSEGGLFGRAHKYSSSSGFSSKSSLSSSSSDDSTGNAKVLKNTSRGLETKKGTTPEKQANAPAPKQATALAPPSSAVQNKAATTRSSSSTAPAEAAQVAAPQKRSSKASSTSSEGGIFSKALKKDSSSSGFSSKSSLSSSSSDDSEGEVKVLKNTGRGLETKKGQTPAPQSSVTGKEDDNVKTEGKEEDQVDGGDDSAQQAKPPKETTVSLIIRIINAADLRSADSMLQGGKSDPYCTCQIVGKPETLFQTETIKKSVNPSWNHEQVLHDVALTDSIGFHVYDWDRGKGDDSLGHVTVDASDWLLGIDETFKLADAGKNRNATLAVQIKVQRTQATPHKRASNASSASSQGVFHRAHQGASSSSGFSSKSSMSSSSSDDSQGSVKVLKNATRGLETKKGQAPPPPGSTVKSSAHQTAALSPSASSSSVSSSSEAADTAIVASAVAYDAAPDSKARAAPDSKSKGHMITQVAGVRSELMTYQEAQTKAEAITQAAQGSAQAAQAFVAMDSDGNGVLTAKEVYKFTTKEVSDSLPHTYPYFVKEDVCACGTIFIPDSIFCRLCGTKRPKDSKQSERRRKILTNRRRIIEAEQAHVAREQNNLREADIALRRKRRALRLIQRMVRRFLARKQTVVEINLRREKEMWHERSQREYFEYKLQKMEEARRLQRFQEDGLLRNNAATKIQNMFRAKRARGHVQGLKAQRGELLALMAKDAAKQEAMKKVHTMELRMRREQTQKHHHATRLQAMWRGKQDRRLVATKRRQIEVRRTKDQQMRNRQELQRKEAREREREQEMHKSASGIQAMWRGRQARKEVMAKKASMNQSPAARREYEKQRAKQRLHAYEKGRQEGEAALKIQSRFRGLQARRSTASKRASWLQSKGVGAAGSMADMAHIGSPGRSSSGRPRTAGGGPMTGLAFAGPSPTRREPLTRTECLRRDDFIGGKMPSGAAVGPRIGMANQGSPLAAQTPGGGFGGSGLVSRAGSAGVAGSLGASGGMSRAAGIAGSLGTSGAMTGAAGIAGSMGASRMPGSSGGAYPVRSGGRDTALASKLEALGADFRAQALANARQHMNIYG